MLTTRHLALVSETATVSFSDLTQTSAALQKQTIRDLAPIWEVQATVDSFASLEDVPNETWPIIIRDDIHVKAEGIHEDDQGQPFALVRASDSWSLTASHEVLEMLVDPFGRRLSAGPSPIEDQDRVEFLVEICDPSEDARFSYTISGIVVSDFYTPNYFDPAPNPAVRYSFTASIKEPRQVLKGGYLSWHDPASNDWFQENFFGSTPQFRNLGPLTIQPRKNFRRLIYDVTPEARKGRQLSKTKHSKLLAARQSVLASSSLRAKSLTQIISEVIAESA